MGFLGDIIGDVITGVKNLVAFFVLYTLFIFVAGSFFGIYYYRTPMFWWPIWLLFIGLLLYVVSGAIGPKGKKR
ncbi:hypothetical protein HYS54_04845 [Candidatus Micrarchaeota archaeon]|nr:hypothetical protein [Candidatus Micrarchaeota archaeon]